MSESNVLVYLVRRDMRVSDNPILHHLSTNPHHGFTHLLPVFTFVPHQMEVSGLLKEGEKSPYPEARSHIGKYWRCGPHRAKFIGECVWNMKENLQKVGSNLTITVGCLDQVVKDIVRQLKGKGLKIGAVWMIAEEGYEESQDEKNLSKACSDEQVDHKFWVDEKYFIDDRDLTLEKPQDLPDVYTTYRKMMEPLREKPRQVLPPVKESSLPAKVDPTELKVLSDPFNIPDSLDELIEALLRPLGDAFPAAPPHPDNVDSAHPFAGGEDSALQRMNYLVKSGRANSYKDTRNGLLGTDFSTKLSAYLSQGCVSARQVHQAMLELENGTNDKFSETEGYGKGENEGTKAIRLELLWRDYMRLCTRKFGAKLFRRSGFSKDYVNKWKSANPEDLGTNQKESPEQIADILQRIFGGTTGMGLIDASQRELIHTGYTSNRARQNVASFLAKHLGIDWRYGAEWYEMCLLDYDVSSNWANWQYVSGVGNDPRGEARIFNPVKQAFDYDKEGKYVRSWVPELGKVENLENLFQACTTSKEDRERFGLTGLVMVEDPVKRISFSVDGKPKSGRRSFARRRGNQGSRGNPSNGKASAGPGVNNNAEPNKFAANGQNRPFVQYNGYSNPNGMSRGGNEYRGGRGGGGLGRGPRTGFGFPGGTSRGGYGGGQGQWQPGYPQGSRNFMQSWFPNGSVQ